MVAGSKYEQYISLMRKLADVNYASAVLQWDQEVYMPKKGAESRAGQLTTLAGISHEMATTAELGDLISELMEDGSLSEKQKNNIRESKRNYDDKLKYPNEFVVRMSRKVSEAFNAWQEAREKADFGLYARHLEALVDMKLEECELLGYEGHPYDALINQHEPGETKDGLDRLFADVAAQLVPFVKTVQQYEKPEDGFLYKRYDRDKQWEYGLKLLRQMGFDFDAGRQDISAHPFTINFSSHDVRVTTRINENNMSEMIWSCIHEGGHALYEQGLPFEDYGLPSGEYLSLGIHESQSRLWENNVGRSYGYWEHNYNSLQDTFPENLGAVSLESFYNAINRVESSLIRTSADELTYHLHILIRYELEIALMEKQISVADLPAEWNRRYKDYLGVDVPDNKMGVLQDVHWSHGSFGYFPTYSIGSFMAAQFYNRATEEIPDLSVSIRQGNMIPLRKWLNDKIHKHGRQMRSGELCELVTGEQLNLDHFMKYAEQKYSGIYGKVNA